ncbi:MAG: FHA domain-containing protein [Oscillochloridaceae bacterium umkhey_bin13]
MVRIIALKTDQAPLLEAQVGYSSATGIPLAAQPQMSITVNGTRINDVTTIAEQRELAVAIVADLSARMSDQGTGARSRYDDMLPSIKDLVGQLSADGHFASLVTFDRQVNLPHPLTYDLGAIGNTLNRANSAQSFESAPLTSGDPADPYPLNDALLAALDQLATAPEASPRVLVVFASGTPELELSEAVQIRLAEQQQLKRPVYLIVFGFGSDQPATFQRFPAGPDQLARLAAVGGGQFIALGTTPLDAQARRAIDQVWLDVRQFANQYRLRFNASDIGPGAATITVTAGGASDSVQFNLDAIPPRFNVVVDTRNFQDQVRLGIQVEFQQAPISRVEYFLNDLPLGFSEQAPEFTYQVNAYDAAFQQQFPPGHYALTAAAFDANGNQNRSERPQMITIFAPPPPPPLTEQIVQLWPWLLAGVLLIGGLGFWLWRSRQAPTGRLQPSLIPTPGRQEVPTQEHQPVVVSLAPKAHIGDSVAVPAAPGVTTEFTPQPTSNHTTEFKPQGTKTTRLQTRWVVEVLEGDHDAGRRFELVGIGDQRYFDIGRADPPRQVPHLVLKSSLVSKGQHARLGLLKDGVGIELTAGESRNGTFIGLEQQKLEPNMRHILKHHDIFWLSPGVKLRVLEEDVL